MNQRAIWTTNCKWAALGTRQALLEAEPAFLLGHSAPKGGPGNAEEKRTGNTAQKGRTVRQ